MFESVEIGHTVSIEAYEEQVPALRAELLNLQNTLRESKDFSVVILINGIDGAGKSEVVNLLNEWMDPRHIETWTFSAEQEHGDGERPEMWRFLQILPEKGKIAVLFGNWYTDLIYQRVDRELKAAELDQRLENIVRLERMLVRESVLLIKLWVHLSQSSQKKRLRELERDAQTRWRITERDWKVCRQYKRIRHAAQYMIRRTSTGEAPWLLVDGSDNHYRSLYVGRVLSEALRRRLNIVQEPVSHECENGGYDTPVPLLDALDGRTLLNTLQLDRPMKKKEYQKKLQQQQRRLALLLRHKNFQKTSLVLVFEGNDAAGKGGAIRRVSAALDARSYRIFPIGSPSDEELARPYLWRFWRRWPPLGKVAIFDRSWYGRVLVERVEGFCSEMDWMRAYSEINYFEDQLIKEGALIIKFWLAIDEDEQLTRFKARQAEPHKRFKITPEDWRNRSKRDAYERAVCDMIDRTSTEQAPWTLVEANNKRFARIKVLQTICDRLEEALEH